MTNSKLRIDLSNGLLEVEGDEALVRDVYKDFKDQLAKASSTPHKPQQHPSPPKAPAPAARPRPQRQRVERASPEATTTANSTRTSTFPEAKISLH